MNKESFYFIHDYNAHTDPKTEKLIFEMGWEGYGLFWAIIEKLAQETGTWKMQKDYKRIAFALHSQEDKIKKIVENYELFLHTEKMFWSKRLHTHFQHRRGLSAKRRKAAESRWKQGEPSDANAMQVHSKCNAIKGKERKGKEMKEKDINIEKIYQTYPLKKSKKEALKAIEKAYCVLQNKNQENITEFLIGKINLYIKMKNPEINFKYPATWFDKECWDDEYAKPQQQPQQQASPNRQNYVKVEDNKLMEVFG